MNTACAYPYGIIVSCNGGKLVWLKRYLPDSDEYIVHAMACHWSKPDWRRLYRTSRKVKRTDIVKDWRHAPSAGAISRAAAKCAKLARA